MRSKIFIFTILLISTIQSVFALGIRTFVAVPIAKGDWIFRLFDVNNPGTGTNVLNTGVVYGLDAKHALFFDSPVTIRPSGARKVNNVGFFYRYTAYQADALGQTFRIGLLGGGIVPTGSNGNRAIRAGGVVTYFKGRNQIDSDLIWSQGLGNTLNNLRYDVSWQFRLSPSEHDDNVLGSALNTVVEYNGRQLQNQNVRHQITAGLQWVSPQWMLETGLVHDLNFNKDTSLVAGIRIHV